MDLQAAKYFQQLHIYTDQRPWVLHGGMETTLDFGESIAFIRLISAVMQQRPTHFIRGGDYKKVCPPPCSTLSEDDKRFGGRPVEVMNLAALLISREMREQFAAQ